MSAVDVAVPVTARFEGLFLRPYLCPAGVPSIGYGTTHYENGTRVTLADAPITVERAKELLLWELRTQCLPALKRRCPMVFMWGEDAVAALLDFTYNLGEPHLAASTLRQRIQADDKEGAQRELLKWVHGGGRVLPGLVKRRVAECALVGQ